MFSSIRARLTASHLLVIMLAMSLSGFLLLSFLERYFLQAAEESLTAQAVITAQALIPGATTNRPPVDAAPAYSAVQQQQASNLALQAQNLPAPAVDLSSHGVDLGVLADASFQLSAQLDTRIRILDPVGVVQVDSQQTEQGADLSADPLVAEALTGQYASHTDQDRVMHVALPALVDERPVGVIYLSQPLDDVTAVLYDLRIRWLISTGMALLFSGVAGLLLARMITRPLRQLTAAAGVVAEGRFDRRVPVRSRDELGRLSSAFNDMTGRLQAARQMQIDFVADVSHELRTPLTAVKGLVETLRDGAVDDREVRDRFLETVESETDRLVRLVNDLLLLSRADSEALNLRREAVDLEKLIRPLMDRLAPAAAGREVDLRLEAPPEAVMAWADSDRIEQVVLNLLDNGIKYSRPGGVVTVMLDGEPAIAPESRAEATVRVRDDGMGIPAEHLPHLGRRFYRADRARSRSDGGSGLGLAIAQALIEAHGGRLWLESQEGAGTVASFTLPSP